MSKTTKTYLYFFLIVSMCLIAIFRLIHIEQKYPGSILTCDFETEVLATFRTPIKFQSDMTLTCAFENSRDFKIRRRLSLVKSFPRTVLNMG